VARAYQKGNNEYISIYKPDHPRAAKSGGYQGYVYEHILVAEKILGRHLHLNEDVHHLSFNHKDNRPENLLILLHGQHTKLHNFMRRHELEQKFKDTAEEGHFVKVCFNCNDYLVYQDRYCDDNCREEYREKVKPSKQELEELLKELNVFQVANKFGLHNVIVRQWIKDYQIA
jgi:hypothetical protein